MWNTTMPKDANNVAIQLMPIGNPKASTSTWEIDSLITDISDATVLDLELDAVWDAKFDNLEILAWDDTLIYKFWTTPITTTNWNWFIVAWTIRQVWTRGQNIKHIQFAKTDWTAWACKIIQF